MLLILCRWFQGVNETENIQLHNVFKRHEAATIQNMYKCRDGRDGRNGLKGFKGDVGPPGDNGHRGNNGKYGESGDEGEKGIKGSQGQKGEYVVGVTYIRWGHDSCPGTGAELVYSGRAAGQCHSSRGGGTNPQQILNI